MMKVDQSVVTRAELWVVLKVEKKGVEMADGKAVKSADGKVLVTVVVSVDETAVRMAGKWADTTVAGLVDKLVGMVDPTVGERVEVMGVTMVYAMDVLLADWRAEK